MPAVPSSEILARHASLRRRLARSEEPVDAVIALQKADVYYLAGTTQQCHVLVAAAGGSRLLVRKVLERAREDSPLDDIRPMQSLKELPAQLRELCGPPPWRIGMELDVLPANAHRAYAGIFGEQAEIVDAAPAILGARSVKSDWEIERISEAAALHAGVFALAPDLLAGEISTFDLQTALEKRACDLGHCGAVRMRGLDVECSIGVVVSGPDGAVPSQSMFPIGGVGTHPWIAAGGSRAPIARDTPVILDFLMSTSGYHADCTRMTVRGKFPDEALAVLERIGSILRAIEAQLRPGALPSAIYESAIALAKDAGLAGGFMGPAGYQVRFVGHGVGLEVNESPVLAPRFDEPLAAGMTFAVEPKFTDPRWGVIGLENTYVVREGGPTNLTPLPEAVLS